MNQSPFALILGVALAALACGSEDNPTGPGTAHLRFSVSNGVRRSPLLVDPLRGPVYGKLYLSEDVSVSGPRDGAQSFGDIEAEGTDVRSADTSTASWTSAALDPNLYVFLGMMDVDGNGATTRDPDAGDPVTLPVTNKFQIESQKTVEVTILFDLVFD